MDAGQQLFEARQRRGLTLDDISRTTKIPASVLYAIERNDERGLPQKFFTRAFVRTYAAEVGLKADDLLDHYGVEHVDECPAAIGTVEEPASSRSLLLVAAAAVFTIYYGYSLQQASSSMPQVVEAAIEQPISIAAATDRGDITLPAAETVQPEPIAPRRPVVQTPRHERIASIEAIFDTLPASAVEPAPVMSDAVLPQSDATVHPAPVEQF